MLEGIVQACEGAIQHTRVAVIAAAGTGPALGEGTHLAEKSIEALVELLLLCRVRPLEALCRFRENLLYPVVEGRQCLRASRSGAGSAGKELDGTGFHILQLAHLVGVVDTTGLRCGQQHQTTGGHPGPTQLHYSAVVKHGDWLRFRPT